MKNILLRSETEHKQLQEASQLELEHLRTDLNKYKNDKEKSQLKLKETEHNYDLIQRKLTLLQQENKKIITNLENNLLNNQIKLKNSEEQIVLLRENNTELNNNLINNKALLKNYENQINELKEKMKMLENNFKNEIDSIAPKYQEQTEKYIKKMTLAINKEKKRSDGYKMKALDIHNRYKAMIKEYGGSSGGNNNIQMELGEI